MVRARVPPVPIERRYSNMLLAIAAVLLALWLLGVVVIVAHFLGIGRSSATA